MKTITNCKLSISPLACPEAARKYASLSPDFYCEAHLNNWIEEHGKSLTSYKRWLEFRLNTDSDPIGEPDIYTDTDWLDWTYLDFQVNDRDLDLLNYTFTT
jgi:hypothetical protein